MSHKRNEFTETPKDQMRTPPSLFKKLDDRFNFDIDVAATKGNALCPLCYTVEDNALNQDWRFVHWPGGYPSADPQVPADPVITSYCNPPYNRFDLPLFVRKGYEESLKGATVVMLLPVDFSTRWWDYCMEAAEWIRIKGRIHFNDMNGIPIKGSPLFDSCVVVFDTKLRNQRGFVVSEMDWR